MLKQISFIFIVSLLIGCQQNNLDPTLSDVDSGVGVDTQGIIPVSDDCKEFKQVYDENNKIGVYGQLQVFPTLLLIDSSTEEKYVEAFKDAAFWWNDDIGEHIFDVKVSDNINDHETCGWVIALNTIKLDDPVVGQAWWSSCNAYVEVATEKMLLNDGVTVAAHELGHVLNLRHEEDDIESLMNPYVGGVISKKSHCLVKMEVQHVTTTVNKH